jgi:hypothetical protein
MGYKLSSFAIKNKKLKVPLIGIGFFLLMCLAGGILSPIKRAKFRKEIKEHQKISIGTLDDSIYQREGRNLKYTFIANKRTLTLYQHDESVYNWHKLIGKQFPILYDSLDPEGYSLILAHKPDFAWFNLNIDSLRKCGLKFDSIE